jgi:archaellum component FlaG (FlaF/FlaG flagellin family)
MLGQDVAEAIGNAAENNALFLIPIAVALIKAIDVGLTAKDAYDLAEAIDAGDEEEANRLATEFAINAVLSVTCEDK